MENLLVLGVPKFRNSTVFEKKLQRMEKKLQCIAGETLDSLRKMFQIRVEFKKGHGRSASHGTIMC